MIRHVPSLRAEATEREKMLERTHVAIRRAAAKCAMVTRCDVGQFDANHTQRVTLEIDYDGRQPEHFVEEIEELLKAVKAEFNEERLA